MITTDNTWKELKDSGVDTAVVAFGAIEQHGHHLPLATDWIGAAEGSKMLAEELNAFLLPAMPYGCSREHMAFPGTITLRPATLAAVLEDIVESLRHHGFRKIVVLSSHGGNWILKPTLRELNFKYPELSLVHASGPITDEGDAPAEDIHSGKGETSRMMFWRPELVKEEHRHLDSPGFVGQEFNDYVGCDKTTKAGAWGRPSEASAELGEQAIREGVRKQAAYVRWAFAKVAELKRAPGAVDD